MPLTSDSARDGAAAGDDGRGSAEQTMAKKGRGAKGESRKRERRRGPKDVAGKRGDVRGGAAPPSGKLTFGAPSLRPTEVDPSNPNISGGMEGTR